MTYLYSAIQKTQVVKFAEMCNNHYVLKFLFTADRIKHRHPQFAKIQRKADLGVQT